MGQANAGYPEEKRVPWYRSGSSFDPRTETYFFRVFRTKENRNTIVTFRKAESYFGFRISSIRTDDGGEFSGVFHTWLTRKKIPRFFILKKSP
jgi:hypothetical protein